MSGHPLSLAAMFVFGAIVVRSDVGIAQEPPELLNSRFDEDEAQERRCEWAEQLGIETELENSIGMKLTLLPAGRFLMGGDQTPRELAQREFGSTLEQFTVFFEREQPRHGVRITQPFYVGTFEVTQNEWEQVMSSNPSDFSAGGEAAAQVEGMDTSRFPVERVSWYDAIEFCNALSLRENLPAYYELTDVWPRAIPTIEGRIESADISVLGGTGYRLLTEAEWEYACRAGTLTAFYFGDSNDDTLANFHGVDRTTTVGSYPPNAFGLHDMHGNVSEWCFDEYDSDVYGDRSGASENPVVLPNADESDIVYLLVHRGGGYWASFGSSNLVRVSGVNGRSGCRGFDHPVSVKPDLGFRVARNP